MKRKNIFEAKGGMMTKNDIIHTIECTLEALAKSHKGELTVPVYHFHIQIYEIENLLIVTENTRGESAPSVGDGSNPKKCLNLPRKRLLHTPNSCVESHQEKP
jgi:hypothetical protein